jgi:hypothetical protein
MYRRIILKWILKKKGLSVIWINLAPATDWYQALVNIMIIIIIIIITITTIIIIITTIIIILKVPQEARNFLTN